MSDFDSRVCAFSMPYPPSVNGMYNRSPHGVFVKEKVKQYKKEVYFTLRNKIICFEDASVFLDISIYPPDKRERDIDNILKVTFDCIQLLTIVNRDSQIQDLAVHRKFVIEKGRIDLIIHAMNHKN